MYLLRVYLLSSLYYQLVPDTVTQGMLAWLDRIVQMEIRQQLRLPHNTPHSMIHARVADGCFVGTCTTLVCTYVRIMKRDWIEKLFACASSNDDVVLTRLTQESDWMIRYRGHQQLIKLDGAVVTSTYEVRRKLQRSLQVTVDGIGLYHHGAVSYVHSWVTDGNQLMSHHHHHHHLVAHS